MARYLGDLRGRGGRPGVLAARGRVRGCAPAGSAAPAAAGTAAARGRRDAHGSGRPQRRSEQGLIGRARRGLLHRSGGGTPRHGARRADPPAGPRLGAGTGQAYQARQCGAVRARSAQHRGRLRPFEIQVSGMLPGEADAAGPLHSFRVAVGQAGARVPGRRPHLPDRRRLSAWKEPIGRRTGGAPSGRPRSSPGSAGRGRVLRRPARVSIRIVQRTWLVTRTTDVASYPVSVPYTCQFGCGTLGLVVLRDQAEEVLLAGLGSRSDLVCGGHRG